MLETDLKNSIISWVEEHLAPTDQFLVNVSLSPRNAPYKIKVTIDGDGDVAISDCESLNRSLLKRLADHDAMAKYGLEVSTPGLDSPLKLIRQYKKNKGRSIRILMKNGGNREGVLGDVTENTICLRTPTTKEDRPIHFSEIEKAFVQVSFK